MVSRAELKKDAKSQLSGNWGLAIGVFLVYTLIMQITTALSGSTVTGNNETFLMVANIVGLLLYGPMAVGVNKFKLNLATKKNEAKFTDLFSGFNLFLKSSIITVLFNLAVILGTMLFVIPGIIASLMFSQSFIILAQNPEKSAIDCLKESAAIMKGNKMKLFILGLSFIGWMIVCVFTFGIGFLWYTPYYEMTMTNFYLNLNKKQ